MEKMACLQPTLLCETWNRDWLFVLVLSAPRVGLSKKMRLVGMYPEADDGQGWRTSVAHGRRLGRV